MGAMTHFVFGRVAPGGGTIAGEPDDDRFPDYPYEIGDVVPGAGYTQVDGLAPDGSGRSSEDYLVDRAHRSGTEALLMIGGMGDGVGFFRSASDAVRPRFVDNIVDYLVEHDYDGLDLDWEDCLLDQDGCRTPSGAVITGAEAQRRLLALVDDLRTEMATRPRFADDPGIITFPGYPVKINESGGRPAPYAVDVALRVDQFNLMSYGIGSTWNGGGWVSWFSSPISGAGGLNPVDLSSSIDAYVAAGVPRDRMGIGIGFYGTYFGPSITGPRQSTEGNDIYETDDNALALSELDRMGYLDHGTRHWDEAAQSTYRTYEQYGSSGYVPPRVPGRVDHTRLPAGFLSYEDEQSIAAKADWVRETGVGGTIVWTVNFGWLPESRTNPSLDAVKRHFLGR